MSKSGLVSVIIPCYNQAHFLAEAIESVLGQTYQHYEIIVVDDGSPDNTAEVAAKFPEVRCIRQQNKGLAGARNTGLRASEGEFVVFLDADDRLLPMALMVGVNSLRRRPECGFVYGGYTYIAADGSPMSIAAPPTHAENEPYHALLRTGNFISAIMTIMFRRTVFDAVGAFKSELRAVEDYDLYLRVTRQFPIFCHHEKIAEYRQHGDSMTANHKMMLRISLAVVRAHWKQVKGIKKYEEALKEGLKHHKEIYGGRLVTRVRIQLRARSKGKQVAQDVLTLVRYCPLIFARHAGRKFYCVLFKAEGNFEADWRG